jgi:hypothetical protein
MAIPLLGKAEMASSWRHSRCSFQARSFSTGKAVSSESISFAQPWQSQIQLFAELRSSELSNLP